MKKGVLIFISILIIVLTIIGLYVHSVSVSEKEPSAQTGNQIFTNFTDTDTDNMSSNARSGSLLLAQDGSRLSVNDFLLDNRVQLIDETAGVYQISGNQDDISNDVYYEIFYFSDGTVTITLLNEKLALARELAERELRTVISLSNYDFCLADVSVVTIGSVSEEYSGRNLGLSFCPNSESL